MMMMKQVSLATAASLALCLAANAGAVNNPSYSKEESHAMHHKSSWYVGAGINADVSSENEQDFAISEWYYFNAFETNTDFELEDNDVGFDIYVGKKVNKHFAFEVGYSLVGDLEFTSFDFNSDEDHSADVDQWNVRAVGLVYWPVAEYFNVFLKAGAAYLSSETDFDTANDTNETEIHDFATSEINTFAFLYGAGAEFGMDRWGVRAEYTAFEITEANEETFYISDLIGASVFYRFHL